MASSRDAGHHRESVGLHPTPCTEQPVNRDLRIPAVCLSGFFYDSFYVGHPASCSCPIPSGVPAFLGALMSWRHFPGKSYLLAADYEVVKVHGFGAMPFTYRIWERPFRKDFSELFVNFAIGRLVADASPSTNRNPQEWFHIQFRSVYKELHADRETGC